MLVFYILLFCITLENIFTLTFLVPFSFPFFYIFKQIFNTLLYVSFLRSLSISFTMSSSQSRFIPLDDSDNDSIGPLAKSLSQSISFHWEVLLQVSKVDSINSSIPIATSTLPTILDRIDYRKYILQSKDVYKTFLGWQLQTLQAKASTSIDSGLTQIKQNCKQTSKAQLVFY